MTATPLNSMAVAVLEKANLSQYQAVFSQSETLVGMLNKFADDGYNSFTDKQNNVLKISTEPGAGTTTVKR